MHVCEVWLNYFELIRSYEWDRRMFLDVGEMGVNKTEIIESRLPAEHPVNKSYIILHNPKGTFRKYFCGKSQDALCRPQLQNFDPLG